MPLPKDIKAARNHLQQIADAHPDDERLISLVEQMRHQLQLFNDNPTDMLRAAMENRASALEVHMKAKGYTEPAS